MRKIIYPPLSPPTKTNHIYWEGGIEMAPRNGSTNMMSKSCQYLVFYFVKEVQLYSNDFERVGYSNATYMFGTISHAPSLLPNLKKKIKHPVHIARSVLVGVW